MRCRMESPSDEAMRCRFAQCAVGSHTAKKQEEILRGVLELTRLGGGIQITINAKAEN